MRAVAFRWVTAGGGLLAALWSVSACNLITGASDLEVSDETAGGGGNDATGAGAGEAGPSGSGPSGSGPSGGATSSGAVCGDEACGPGGNCLACGADCGACAATCGDATCQSDETCISCPQDCGTCPAACGNAVCEAGEDRAPRASAFGGRPM